MRREKWIAFNGKCWMAQAESVLGTTTGVLMLRDGCETPDRSDHFWRVTPGWVEEPGLRVLAMTETEADEWEAQSNPYDNAAVASQEMAQLSAQFKQIPLADMLRIEEQGGLAAAAAMRAAQTPGGSSVGAFSAGTPSSPSGTILKLAGEVLFIGEVDGSKKPCGEGELLLGDGSVHKGSFVNGRPSGPGTYYDRSGSVAIGQWQSGLRVGEFSLVDKTGVAWTERYNAEGKKVARKKTAQTDTEAAVQLEQPVPCLKCPSHFNALHNFRCRYHKGLWERRPCHPDFPDGGYWLCCESKSAKDPGCHLTTHVAF